MNLPPSLVPLVVTVAVLCGLAQCFLGYRLLRFFLGILGVFVGGMIGLGVADMVSAGNVWIMLLLGLVGGLLGALLFSLIFYLGIFVLGAYVGASILWVIQGALGTRPNEIWAVVGAVVGGLLALAMLRPVIIFLTSFQGAWSVVLGGWCLIHGGSPSRFLVDPVEFLKSPKGGAPVLIVCWVLLAVAGMVVQFRTAPAGSPLRKGCGSGMP